ERATLLIAQRRKLLIALLERVESDRLLGGGVCILGVGFLGGRDARRSQLQARRRRCHTCGGFWRARRHGGRIVQKGDFAGLQRCLRKRRHHPEGGAS